MYNIWSYTKIQLYERIEFILNFAHKDGTKLDPAAVGIPPGVPVDVPHVVTFNALDSNRTEMIVSEFGYATAEARDLSKSGLEQCVDKMAMLFD